MMFSSDTEVVVIGGGAAGIAAARHLHDAGVPCLVVEARARLGGRAWTVTDEAGFALDLGCGWLHSADRNPWRAVAEQQGRTIDKTPPPWSRISFAGHFPLAEQSAFLDVLQALFHDLAAAEDNGSDHPASVLLKPGERWNGLINAVSTYVSGAELERISLRDIRSYDDTGVNWRVVEGYGATIAQHGADLPIVFDCPVRRIDHHGRRLKIEAAQGDIAADRVIITVPSAIIAEERLVFSPALPEKIDAAAGLPLGLADKLFLSLDGAEEFEKESRLFGRTDRSATGFYHFRPFGRPQIEAYFGGTLAAELEANGEAAFLDFAIAELKGLLGSAFARRVGLLHLHRWGRDSFARGSYSFALPGAADSRATLAATVDDRLFFAGEACSRADFSTAHGAWATGIAAAEQAMARRRRPHG